MSTMARTTFATRDSCAQQQARAAASALARQDYRAALERFREALALSRRLMPLLTFGSGSPALMRRCQGQAATQARKRRRRTPRSRA